MADMSRVTIVTVGSVNVDLIAFSKRKPHMGETLIGEKFIIRPGGKGANQAVRVAISGGESFFVGRIGKDIFSDLVTSHLTSSGVDTSFLRYDSVGTGIGHVRVENGDYETVIVAGANDRLDIDDIEAALPAFRRSSALLLQLEVPMKAIVHAAKRAKEMGLTVCLNAAPARELPRELDGLVDTLIVNEIEAQMLSGVSRMRVPDDCSRVAGLLSELAERVVISLGAKGVFALDGTKETKHFPGHRVAVADSIGAGDAFIAELMVRMLEGRTFFESVERANAVAALVISSAEGILCMPENSAIERLLSKSSAESKPQAQH
jgi:ribokinase